MALTIREQLNILDGTAKPTDAGSNFNFEDIVRQATIMEANEFVSGQKEPSLETDEEAYLYAEAMRTTSSGALLTNRSTIFNNVSRLIIAIYAETGDYATVLAANEADWTTFIESTMLEAFEIYASVKPSWKIAYDAHGVTTTTTTTV